MKRDFLTGLGLEDEQVNQIMAEHGKTVNSVKEKADTADTLQSQIDDYKQQISDRDDQLKKLEKQAQGNEDLQKQIQDLQKANDETKKEWEEKLTQQRKESKLELALKDAKAKNPKAVKALLDAEKVSLDGDNLIGLEDQLSALRESDAYLFGDDEPAGLKGRDPHPGTSDDPNSFKGKNPFKRESLNLTEQARLFKENPELAKSLQAQA